MGIVPTHIINTNNVKIKSKNQSISIIISAYQTSEFIEETLDSIENQTYFINNDNYEVLIGVDACEETLEKLLLIKNKYRNVRVFMMNENKGTYITSNTLIEISKNDIIVRFDSDDIMTPEMIDVMISNINDVEIVRCKYYNYHSLTKKSVPDNIYANGIVMFKKLVFETCGGYQPWVCSADTELLKRATLVFKQKLINKHLFYYRKHGGSLTNRIDMKIRLGYHKQMNNELKINRIINEYYEK